MKRPLFAVGIALVAVCYLPTLRHLDAQQNQKPKTEFEGFTPEYAKKLREESKRRKDAVEKAKAEVLASPESAEAHFNLAEAYSDDALSVNNHYDEIAIEYKRAIKINPNYAEAYNGLARIYGSMNEFKKQFEAFDNAISLRPDFAEAYCNLGFAHLWENIAKSGAYPDFHQEMRLAASAFEHAILIKPDYAAAFRGLGEANQYLDLKEAVEAFTQSIRFDPDSEVAHLELGRTYVELGNRSAALKEYEDLLDLAKESKEDDAEDFANILLKEIQKKFGVN